MAMMRTLFFLIAFFLFVVSIQADLENSQNLNGTRRNLRARLYNGSCKATNPIDACWRCDNDWALHRERLADCALGFGKNAIGGRGGSIYVVTDNSDNDVINPAPGTLRHAVIQPEPLWIIFSRSMTIKLSQELIMTSFKTIDGRGHQVKIKGGAGITLQEISNVIIHSLYIQDIVKSYGGLIRDSTTHVGLRLPTDGDAIDIWSSSNIWIDHISMRNSMDGLIDVVQSSTNITISNCHFTDHDKVMLFGATETNEDDRNMKVTVAYSHFGKRLVQRMPRSRFGFTNLVNNAYTHWEMYAIGGSNGARIMSQGNRFIAQRDHPETREITHRTNPFEDWQAASWTSTDDAFRNGAFFTTSGNQTPDLAEFAYGMIPHAPAKMVGEMTLFAGALGRCIERRPC